MGTFAWIAFYSAIVLAAMTLAASAFTFLGVWITEQSPEEHGGH